jgi:versiconal hemiacetal acetate esterase
MAYAVGRLLDSIQLGQSSLEDAGIKTLIIVFKAHANASTFHGDPSRFYLMGGSAGGSLALAVANHIIAHQPDLQPSLKGIVAQVPSAVHASNVPTKYQSIFKS